MLLPEGKVISSSVPDHGCARPHYELTKHCRHSPASNVSTLLDFDRKPKPEAGLAHVRTNNERRHHTQFQDILGNASCKAAGKVEIDGIVVTRQITALPSSKRMLVQYEYSYSEKS